MVDRQAYHLFQANSSQHYGMEGVTRPLDDRYAWERRPICVKKATRLANRHQHRTVQDSVSAKL